MATKPAAPAAPVTTATASKPRRRPSSSRQQRDRAEGSARNAGSSDTASHPARGTGEARIASRNQSQTNGSSALPRAPRRSGSHPRHPHATTASRVR
jgi:hypothetical protein